MKKTYISPVLKCVELSMEDGIMNPTSNVSLMSTSLENGDEQLVKGFGIFGTSKKDDITNSNAWDDEEDW